VYKHELSNGGSGTVCMSIAFRNVIQGGSNINGDDLRVNKSQFVPVIFEPPCILRNCVTINAQNFKVANKLVRKCILTTPVRLTSRYK
jgi:hypothetical protein